MRFRRKTNRAHRSDDSVDTLRAEESADEPTAIDDAAVDSVTADQHREWRRWIVETFLDSSYGVVPVDHLVDQIVEREPEDVERSTVRTALTEQLLPQLDRERVLDYDVDRELLINYGD